VPAFWCLQTQVLQTTTGAFLFLPSSPTNSTPSQTKKTLETLAETSRLYRHGALRFRLARYGYKTSPVGQSKAYTPILEENRINLRPVE
jgi:hypothetical protein